MSDRLIASSAGAGPYLVGPEIEERLREGTQTTYTYEGSLSECQSQRAIARASGATSISLSPSGGLWRLSVSYAGTPEDEGGPEADPPVNLHEIEVVAEQVPIWKAARLAAYMTTDADIPIVRRWVEGYLASAPLYDAGALIENPTKAQYITKMQAETTTDAQAESLFNRVVNGGDTVIDFLSVYRRSITAASATQVQAAYTGVGKIWTSAEVVAFEGVPTSEWFGLDASAQWHKSPPTVRAAAYGKTEISYYYTEVRQASNFQYQAYSSATLLD